MTNEFLVLLSLFGAFWSLQVHAKCNGLELSKISSDLSETAMTISKLDKIYSRINKCKAMDGEYAEGFNDEANKLLVNSWTEVIKAKEIKNKEFRNALIKSLSDGSEKKTFDKICLSAEHCASFNLFCKEMKSQCEETKDWIKTNIK